MISIVNLSKFKVILKKQYNVVEHVEFENGAIVPVLAIPMLSDERWQEIALKQQTKN